MDLGICLLVILSPLIEKGNIYAQIVELDETLSLVRVSCLIDAFLEILPLSRRLVEA